MGVVFRGRDESLDRDVALKVMRAKAAGPEDEERFLREARAVARLQHPNIVTIYELGEHDGLALHRHGAAGGRGPAARDRRRPAARTRGRRCPSCSSSWPAWATPTRTASSIAT